MPTLQRFHSALALALALTRARARTQAVASAFALAFVVAFAFAAHPGVAHAQAAGVATDLPELSLDAQARALVDNDWMTVVLSVEQEGPRVQELTQRVLATLQSAAARARARPGIEVRVGSVGTQPVWGPKGRTGNWQVRGLITLQSTEVAALGLLASELTSEMQIASVNFSLSRARSDEVESQLMAEAADAFKCKAQRMATALGFQGYGLKSVSLSQAGGALPPRAPMALRSAMASADAAAVPIPSDGGKTEVVLTMSGSVRLR